MKRFELAVCGLLLLSVAAGARAQSAENVAVVINDADAASRKVGEYYVSQRRIPEANVIRIKTSTDDTIERDAFVTSIRGPIVSALIRGGLMDRILYIVLTKGIPLRIAGTGGPDGTVASVDSELTTLYRFMVTGEAPARGRVDNPYFLGTNAVETAQPFTHRAFDIFLVSRLDGFTADDAIALVDRASKPSADGRIVLDQRAVPAAKLGDEWLAEAARRLAAGGQADRVMLESSPTAARDVKPVLGYYSWGSSDPQNRVRRSGMSFVPGAIAATFVSTDARTFREPPADWMPTGNTLSGAGAFAGAPHSLVGDLIRDGVTGVAGQVSEPYLESVVRPDILFAAYVAGFNLIESYYLALPHLSWQSIVVGDPLCRPFAHPSIPTADLDSPIDAATTLPKFFSERRMRQLTADNPGTPAAAIAAWARSTALLLRDDEAGSVEALKETVALAPKAVTPRLMLAVSEEKRQRYDAAGALYQEILALDPKNIIALNNYAFLLAVRQGQPRQALPIAQRAVTLAPTAGTILDTLAWIEHLLGDDTAAGPRLAEAIRRDPGNADIRLHAAAVYAANGARGSAEAELKEALRLNPALESSDDVKAIRAKLAALKQ